MERAGLRAEYSQARGPSVPMFGRQLLRLSALLPLLAGCSGTSSSDPSRSNVASSSGSATGTVGGDTTYVATYKALTRAATATVSYPSGCSMFITLGGAPAYHDAYHLTPVSTDYPTAVAETPVSHMQMAVVPYLAGEVSASSATLNICPSKGTSTTATELGLIGYAISGEALFNAYEGTGTPALSDNVSYALTDSDGNTHTASFIDR
jgi:hypothetical protein